MPLWNDAAQAGPQEEDLQDAAARWCSLATAEAIGRAGVAARGGAPEPPRSLKPSAVAGAQPHEGLKDEDLRGDDEATGQGRGRGPDGRESERVRGPTIRPSWPPRPDRWMHRCMCRHGAVRCEQHHPLQRLHRRLAAGRFVFLCDDCDRAAVIGGVMMSLCRCDCAGCRSMALDECVPGQEPEPRQQRKEGRAGALDGVGPEAPPLASAKSPRDPFERRCEADGGSWLPVLKGAWHHEDRQQAELAFLMVKLAKGVLTGYEGAWRQGRKLARFRTPWKKPCPKWLHMLVDSIAKHTMARGSRASLVGFSRGSWWASAFIVAGSSASQALLVAPYLHRIRTQKRT